MTGARYLAVEPSFDVDWCHVASISWLRNAPSNVGAIDNRVNTDQDRNTQCEFPFSEGFVLDWVIVYKSVYRVKLQKATDSARHANQRPPGTEQTACDHAGTRQSRERSRGWGAHTDESRSLSLVKQLIQKTPCARRTSTLAAVASIAGVLAPPDSNIDYAAQCETVMCQSDPLSSGITDLNVQPHRARGVVAFLSESGALQGHCPLAWEVCTGVSLATREICTREWQSG